jgi:hypothetical protein
MVMLAVAGCGGTDQGTIRGRLLHKDGTPLAGARVVVRSGETGQSAHATTDANGEFQIGLAAADDGVTPGNYDLTIVENRGDIDHRRPPTIATKYKDPARSGLSVSVQPGESKELQLTLDPP